MDRLTLIALVAVLLLLVTGYVILDANNRDVSSYAIFVAGPLVSSIVGVVLSQRVASVKTVSEDIRHQTNSMLTTRLDSLASQLDHATEDRAPKDVQPLGPQDAGVPPI